MYIPDSHKSHPPPPPPPPHQQPPRPPIDFQSHVHHPHAPLEDPDDDDTDREMMIDVVTATTTTKNTNPTIPHPNSHPFPHHQIVLNELSSGGEDHDQNSTTLSGGNGTPPSSTAPKKRAETWVQDETRNLISYRREMDLLFNTSKSNKHLWEEISAKMKERGFDRSPTMCTDKWRNLLKEFKKVKQNVGNGSPKMLYYKDIEEILKERNKNCITTAVALSSAPPVFKCGTSGVQTPSTAASKVDSFMQFSDKGIEDAGISFGPIDGDETHSYVGRVISIKWGGYTRRIGIDGTPEAIKEAIKSAFGIRTKRAFWLEDEDNVVRCFDRDMPLGSYTLHLDEGVAIKVLCHYDESEQIAVHTEDKTFYTEDDFREFLNRRGWSSVREYDAYRNIDNLDDLRPDGIYRGVT